MYAMVRRYRMSAGSIDDLMHKVDTQFVDRLQEQLGILHYQAIDTGDGTIMTVTVFEDEGRYRRACDPGRASIRWMGGWPTSSRPGPPGRGRCRG